MFFFIYQGQSWLDLMFFFIGRHSSLELFSSCFLSYILRGKYSWSVLMIFFIYARNNWLDFFLYIFPFDVRENRMKKNGGFCNVLFLIFNILELKYRVAWYRELCGKFIDA